MFREKKAYSFATKNVVTCNENEEIIDCINIMAKENFRRIPVLNNEGNLCGIVTVTDVLKNLKDVVGYELKGLSDRKVSDYLHDRVNTIMTKRVVYIKKESSIHDALEAMIAKDVGAIPIAEDLKVVGIVTERDFVFRLGEICEKYNPDKFKVSDLMSDRVVTVPKDTPIQEAMNVMFEMEFRRLVLENGEYQIVTSRDFLRLFAEDKALERIKKDQDSFFATKCSKIVTKELISVGRDAKISEVSEIMKRHCIGALPVIDGELEGIITERDILLAIHDACVERERGPFKI